MLVLPEHRLKYLSRAVACYAQALADSFPNASRSDLANATLNFARLVSEQTRDLQRRMIEQPAVSSYN